MNEVLKKFLREFMVTEYPGTNGVHITAEKHYAEVFQRLIPKYFDPKEQPK